MKIGKYEIKHPIIQGGMGVGISWDQLAGNVSLEGGWELFQLLEQVIIKIKWKCKIITKKINQKMF